MRIASALDKAKVTDGDAIHIIIAVVESLGHNVEELVINRTTLRNMRSEFRASVAKATKAGFFRNVI